MVQPVERIQAGTRLVDADGRATAAFARWAQIVEAALVDEQGESVDLTDEINAVAADLATANSKITAIEADGPPLGVDQTWTDVLVSRAAATAYQNTTGRPMEVAIVATATGTAVNAEVSVDALTWVAVGVFTASVQSGVRFVVPPAWYYRVSGAVTTLDAWAELS